MDSETRKVLYRYRDIEYLVNCGIMPWGDYEYYKKIKIVCSEYKILRTTPKGCWIKLRSGKERWVNLGSKTAFAHPTKVKAKAAFLVRKRNQIALLKRKLKQAETAKLLGDGINVNGNT